MGCPVFSDSVSWLLCCQEALLKRIWLHLVWTVSSGMYRPSTASSPLSLYPWYWRACAHCAQSALGVPTSVLSPGEGHLPHPTSSTPECTQETVLPLVLACVQSRIHEDSKVLCCKIAFQMVTFPTSTQGCAHDSQFSFLGFST